ncbi:MAG: proton-conducting membrane transporter [Myxococcaceae bacterium]|nr:MAG: proton-conducting membrane transporter [Myxococcaceae bacterium]
MLPEFIRAAAVAAVALPFVAFLSLGLWSFFAEAPSERATSRLVLSTLWLSLAALAAVAVAAARGGLVPAEVHVGTWFASGDYAFELELLLDGPSLTMLLLVAATTALVGQFSVTYLHRDPGFTRYFLLLALFDSGMLLLVGAGSLDLLFCGWELVGLTSTLLVGFFHERSGPVRSSLQVFSIYRLCDLGLLLGAVMLHLVAGTTDFTHAFARPLHGSIAVVLPLLLLLAAIGKSAQSPFGSWLPRAMEGPTASSALFYGALSVHAGVWLLIRMGPLYAHSPWARLAVIAVGAGTAVTSTVAGRVQSDAKVALGLATRAQVGLMFVECGLGWHRLALAHLVLHSIVRGHQLLRAPSSLHEALALRSAGLESHGAIDGLAQRLLPPQVLRWLYRAALDEFHKETLVDRMVVRPVLRASAWIDRQELRLSRQPHRPLTAPAERT